MLLTCDAIKIGYRQSKDGFVVLFAIHPQEMPEGLANAELGSQWQLQLVPLDDDGNPDAGAASPQAPVREGGGIRSDVTPVPRPLNLANHIGMLCDKDRFHSFLADTVPLRWKLLKDGTPTEKAAIIVRSLCEVKSRAEIESNPEALNKWQMLFIRYNNWQRSNPF